MQCLLPTLVIHERKTKPFFQPTYLAEMIFVWCSRKQCHVWVSGMPRNSSGIICWERFGVNLCRAESAWVGPVPGRELNTCLHHFSLFGELLHCRQAVMPLPVRTVKRISVFLSFTLSWENPPVCQALSEDEEGNPCHFSPRQKAPSVQA